MNPTSDVLNEKSVPGSGFLSKNMFASLAIRNYRYYAIGQGLSLIGTWMQTIGLSWLALRLTGSGTEIGLVLALQYLPVLFLAPVGGVIADRYSKRRVLFITQSLIALMALLLAILVAAGIVQMWMVYSIVAITGVFNSADNPARRAFIPEMVDRAQLGNAVALYSVETNLARVIGPAIAGIIIAAAGLAWCFFINAASYIAVLFCLWVMKSGELHRAERVRAIRGQLMNGFRYVRATPILRNVLIMIAIIGTLTYEFQVILPLIAKFTFNGDARSYALLNSAMGIGAVCGGLISAGRQRPTLRACGIGGLGLGGAVLLTAVAPTLMFALGSMLVVGFFSITFTTRGETTLQLESKPSMRSRVMSLWSVAFLGSTPIGGPVIGWLGEHLSPRWGMAVGGVAAIVAGAFGLLAARKMPSPAPTTIPAKRPPTNGIPSVPPSLQDIVPRIKE